MIKVDKRKIKLLTEVEARAWRDEQLLLADISINKIEDGETIEGSEIEWREYRKTLRAWPSTKSFPTTKPKSPKGD